VGESEDSTSDINFAESLHTDVIVMDWAMPGLSGSEATRQLLLAFPGAHLIVLSMHSDHIHVQSALKAGASGYILKEDTVEHLAKAIHSAAVGILYLSPKLSALASENTSEKEAAPVRTEDVAQSTAPGNKVDRQSFNRSLEGYK